MNRGKTARNKWGVWLATGTALALAAAWLFPQIGSAASNGSPTAICVKKNGTVYAIGKGSLRKNCKKNENLVSMQAVVQSVPGPQGLQGPQGDKGDKGDQGETGQQGAQGLTGLKGNSGDRGLQGEQGPIGPQGLQGPQGDKGDKGDQGPAGTFDNSSGFHTHSVCVDDEGFLIVKGAHGGTSRCRSGDEEVEVVFKNHPTDATPPMPQ